MSCQVEIDGFVIRPMIESDMEQLVDIEREAFTEDLQEGEVAPYLHRFLGYPSGNWTATTKDGSRIVGYLQSHPWCGTEPPHLGGHAPIPPVQHAEYMWLFDCSLRREARGKGLAQAMVELCISHARSVGLLRIELIAVNGAEVLWAQEAYGAFKPMHTIPAGSGYGVRQAVRMTKVHQQRARMHAADDLAALEDAELQSARAADFLSRVAADEAQAKETTDELQRKYASFTSLAQIRDYQKSLEQTVMNQAATERARLAENLYGNATGRTLGPDPLLNFIRNQQALATASYLTAAGRPGMSSMLQPQLSEEDEQFARAVAESSVGQQVHGRSGMGILMPSRLVDPTSRPSLLQQAISTAIDPLLSDPLLSAILGGSRHAPTGGGSSAGAAEQGFAGTGAIRTGQVGAPSPATDEEDHELQAALEASLQPGAGHAQTSGAAPRAGSGTPVTRGGTSPADLVRSALHNPTSAPIRPTLSRTAGPPAVTGYSAGQGQGRTSGVGPPLHTPARAQPARVQHLPVQGSAVSSRPAGALPSGSGPRVSGAQHPATSTSRGGSSGVPGSRGKSK